MTGGQQPREDVGRRNLLAGVLLGIGFTAFFDEAVFHQILHWHHFYDRSTPAAGLVTDGLLHAFDWFATVAGLFLFADLRRRHAFWRARWWSGILLGAGGFQLWDGIIHHKLLRLHQIRYDVELLPYDLAWNLPAVVVLIAGVVLYQRSASTANAAVS